MIKSDSRYTVSLILVVRNELTYINGALSSYINQDYPKGLMEIIIVDGMSTDGTREYLIDQLSVLQKRGYKSYLFDNPKLNLASGWNIGIRNANHDFVCRIDAHSEIQSNYVTIGISELVKRKYTGENIAGIGGWIDHKGTGFFGNLFAMLYSSPFGVGNSPFRSEPDSIIESDTAVFAVYWKKVFDKVGLFDEILSRNQDISLHQRMSDHGYQFLTHPNMKIDYYVRSTIPALLKKSFYDGLWVILSGHSYMRHRVPLLFAIYLILFISFVVFLGSRFFGLTLLVSVPLFLYVIVSFYFSVTKTKNLYAVPLSILFFVYHLSYGFGSLCGLWLRLSRKLKQARE